jgi:hypothetical protein
MEVVYSGDWAVHREVVVVDTETVPLSIWVGEKASLEDWVVGWFHTRNKMGRCECDLLDFSEVVFRVLVEGDLSDLTKRVFFV